MAADHVNAYLHAKEKLDTTKETGQQIADARLAWHEAILEAQNALELVPGNRRSNLAPPRNRSGH